MTDLTKKIIKMTSSLVANRDFSVTVTEPGFVLG